MLKQGTFINKKYNRLILGNIWGVLAYCINLMADSLIGGNQLGEVALQAISIVYPLFSLLYFFSFLLGPGSGVLFGKSMGAFREREASRTVGTSMISSVMIGVLLAAGLWLIKEPFLNYYECTGDLLREASAYYNWLIFFAVFCPLAETLYYLIVTDGEAVLVSMASAVDIAANIVLSVILSRKYGIAGLGIATCIGLLLEVSIYLLHFLRKTNSIKFTFCLDVRILWRSIVLSFSIYMYYLFLAVVDIVLNKIIISYCGMEYIPAYSVVNLVLSVFELYEALNISCMGFLSCFLGEKNNHGMDLLFRTITRSTIIMAVCLTAVFFFGAPWVPVLYGMENPVTVKAAVNASRIVAFAALGEGVVYMIAVVSSSLEKPLQSCYFSFLSDVFFPLLLSLLFGSFLGFTGIVIGLGLASYFAIGTYAVTSILKKGKEGFPIYAEDFGEEGISFDLRVSPASVVEVRDAACRELIGRGYEVDHIRLLLEEFFTRVMEKNPGKSVLAECTLLFGADRVRIIIRDDGVLFNFVDENNAVESLNTHVLNSLLEKTEEKNYLLTTSFNRNGFVFEK